MATNNDTASPVLRRIGLIGDVHAEDRRLATALDYLTRAGVDAILCTGDVADGPGCLNTCVTLLQQSGCLTVRGNHDRWLVHNRARQLPDAHHRDQLPEPTVAWLAQLPPSLELNTVAGPLMLCHGVGNNDLRKVWPGTARMGIDRSQELDQLIAAGQLRFVLNGHLHYRVLIDFPNLTLVNAGTLRGRHQPGFTIVDFDAGLVEAYEFRAGQPPAITAERLLRPHGPRRIWRDTQAFDGRWTPTTLYA